MLSALLQGCELDLSGGALAGSGTVTAGNAGGEPTRSFRDPLDRRGFLAARLGLASVLRPLCSSAGSWGSVLSQERIMPSKPSVPRALTRAPWRNYDTSRFTLALRNAKEPNDCLGASPQHEDVAAGPALGPWRAKGAPQGSLLVERGDGDPWTSFASWLGMGPRAQACWQWDSRDMPWIGGAGGTPTGRQLAQRQLFLADSSGAALASGPPLLGHPS